MATVSIVSRKAGPKESLSLDVSVIAVVVLVICRYLLALLSLQLSCVHGAQFAVLLRTRHVTIFTNVQHACV